MKNIISFFRKVLIVFGLLVLTSAIIGKLYEYYSDGSVQLRMNEESGLYYVPLKVNGVEMEFTLDTGCSSMQMSKYDMLKLKNLNVISYDDYIGEIEATDADGNKTICQVYNIDEINIGGYKVRNINCAVSESENAMKLIGQELFINFSKITIDYENDLLFLNK